MNQTHKASFVKPQPPADFVPVAIYTESGLPVFAATIAIVPDGDPRKALSEKADFVLQRNEVARLIRKRRATPGISKGDRIFPSLSDVLSEEFARALAAALAPFTPQPALS